MSVEYEELEGNIYTLTDEEGVSQPFELIDSMEHNGQCYFALVPYLEDDDEEGEGDLIILKSELVDDEELMASIDDDEEYEEVGLLFIKRLQEFFEEPIIEED